MTLETLLIWIVVGLIAGWLASAVVGGGYGLIGDIVIGVVGSFLGSLIFRGLHIHSPFSGLAPAASEGERRQPRSTPEPEPCSRPRSCAKPENRRGVIRGYQAILNEDKLEPDKVTAVIEVKVTPQREGGFDTIAERLSREVIRNGAVTTLRENSQ